MDEFSRLCKAAALASVVLMTSGAGGQTPASASDGGTSAPTPTAEDVEDLLKQPATEQVSRVLGYRIQQHQVQIYTHGTLAVDWSWTEGDPNTFRLREAHVYVGANIYDALQPEIFVQYEHSQTGPPLSLRYAQVDLRLLRELVVARGGLFLVPFGVYNTTLFNRYVSKFSERPLIHGRIVPSTWSEVGAQLHGRWEWAEGRGISYSTYVTNGLLPEPSHPTTLQSAETAAKGFKTVGARLGVDPILGLTTGFSAYRGSTDAAGTSILKVVGFDLLYRRGPFSLEGELMASAREVPGSGDVIKKGFYLAGGYKVHPAFEPVLGFEGYRTSEYFDRLLVGFNFIPLPERFPTAMLKADYSWRKGGEESVTVEFVLGY